MNNIKKINHLSNRYFALRHGESKANILGIILSDPKSGTVDFGLSDKGKEEIRESVKKSLEKGILDKDTIIVSSDFTRARESAEIARIVLGTNKFIISKNLRERNFGDFEKMKDSNYKKVWNYDKLNPNHKIKNVESANEVLARVIDLILNLEKRFIGKKILLVSHGDVLQILQTGFLKTYASKHREIPHLNTSEIRELKLNISV
jgi:probable phosphoglycerate mutase